MFRLLDWLAGIPPSLNTLASHSPLLEYCYPGLAAAILVSLAATAAPLHQRQPTALALRSVCQMELQVLQAQLHDAHHPDRQEAHRQLVIPGPQASAFLEPTDQPLDQVTLSVGLLIKGLLTRLILPRRNHGLNGMLVQPPPNAWVTVALVPGHLLRP